GSSGPCGPWPRSRPPSRPGARTRRWWRHRRSRADSAGTPAAGPRSRRGCAWAVARPLPFTIRPLSHAHEHLVGWRQGAWEDRPAVNVHLALAASAAVISFAFALSTLERWLDRRKPHEAAWTAALLVFTA